MAGVARSVLLLAGRLKAPDEGQPVLALADRLATHGFSAQVLCTSGGTGWVNEGRVIERPGLARRLRRSFAVRGLRPGDGALRRPDVIHVLNARMGPAGLDLAERWHVPYLQTIDDFLAPGDRLRLSRRWCRGLIATSRDLADSLRGEWGVSPELLTVVHPGVAVADEIESPSTSGRVPVIGTAGPLVDSSGYSTFLNAARRVLDGGVDAEFVIAGQGADEVDLRRRAERLRIADRVTFAGQPAVGLQFWSVLDIYCQPANAPATGRSLATAMAFGVTSIASDVAGLRSLVAHGETGLLVPPENSGALAEAIVVLLGDPELARRLGQSGRALIRRDFDPAVESAALASAYRRTLEPGTPARPHAVPASHGRPLPAADP